MRSLEVDLAERSYPIHIGSGILDDSALYENVIGGPQAFVITNETIAPLYLDRLRAALAATETATLILPDGERHKTMDTLTRVLDELVERRFGRDCTVVALGGGVIGDIAGFAAACYQRGCGFIQVPTTLLAQVDSSVGGKTAVNHRAAKNMIGAFHQPRCVVADTSTLETLPARELAAGIAEVVKYGLIRDAEFFDWLEENADALVARKPEALAYAIERSCRNKAEVVAGDELERGNRAILNFGHTFGHAFEAGLGFGAWLHGEAVSAGMCLATELSVRLGWVEPDVPRRVEALLGRFDLPTRAPAQLSAERAFDLMHLDKKVVNKSLRLVLLKSLGRATVVGDVESKQILATLREMRAA